MEVPSFYVREVTTERPNLATCLVCRYGNRPVVLVCVRKLDAAGEQVIAAVDRAVDEGRGLGLESFAIFLSPKPAEVQPKLMSLVRQRGVTMPLTIPVGGTCVQHPYVPGCGPGRFGFACYGPDHPEENYPPMKCPDPGFPGLSAEGYAATLYCCDFT